MHIKWFLVGFAVLTINLTQSLASTKRKKSEEEAKENSINYGLFQSADSMQSKIYQTMLHDATLPVFLVMGLASVVSTLTSNSKSEQNGLHQRNKREAPSSRWTANILKVLGNVQKAIEKYQHLEGEIINDLDESIQREFSGKESL